MFGTLRVVAYLIIACLVAGGLWYISNLKANLAVSELNNETLKNEIKNQQEVMDLMQQDIKKIQQINSQINTELDRQKKEVQALNDKFNVNAKGESRNFGRIAARKPRVVEKLVNKGTVNAFRCLEIASGSPLTEKELNAKTESETNRECPSIANPNFIAVFP
tara:strand:- start:801 stop:1289 length:489 start_codon:yes stop_codon:yes gene_type:complete